MKIYRSILALLTLSLFVCFSGVQGQYQYPTMSTPTVSNASATAYPQYAEYYAIPQGAAPSTTVGAPQMVTSIGNIPSTVYVGTQQQAVPYAQYMSTANYTGGNDLWIQGTTNWTQYAVIPLGATVNLLAMSASGGSGYITDREPDGLIYSQNFYFYPNSQIPFYAAEIGRHVLTFTIGNKVSNPIVIEVTGYYYPGYYNSNGGYSNYAGYGNYAGYSNNVAYGGNMNYGGYSGY